MRRLEGRKEGNRKTETRFWGGRLFCDCTAEGGRAVKGKAGEHTHERLQ